MVKVSYSALCYLCYLKLNRAHTSDTTSLPQVGRVRPRPEHPTDVTRSPRAMAQLCEDDDATITNARTHQTAAAATRWVGPSHTGR